MKIKGTGFAKSPKVVIGAEATRVVVVSETEITAKTAAGSAGKAEVVVSNEMGSSSGCYVVYLCDAADGHESRTG